MYLRASIGITTASTYEWFDRRANTRNNNHNHRERSDSEDFPTLMDYQSPLGEKKNKRRKSWIFWRLVTEAILWHTVETALASPRKTTSITIPSQTMVGEKFVGMISNGNSSFTWRRHKQQANSLNVNSKIFWRSVIVLVQLPLLAMDCWQQVNTQAGLWEPNGIAPQWQSSWPKCGKTALDPGKRRNKEKKQEWRKWWQYRYQFKQNEPYQKMAREHQRAPPPFLQKNFWYPKRGEALEKRAVVTWTGTEGSSKCKS